MFFELGMLSSNEILIESPIQREIKMEHLGFKRKEGLDLLHVQVCLKPKLSWRNHRNFYEASRA
jgi:hypothetical protein